MNKFQHITLLSLIFIPTIVFGQDLTWVNSFTIQSILLIRAIVPVLAGIALLLFIWGLIMFILQSGNEQAKEEGKKRMFWGIIALFVLVAVWGLVALLQQITGVSGAGGPPSAPQINNPY